MALLSFSFIFFTACDDAGEETNVVFEEQEESAFESEELAETMFDVIESITNSAINLSDANTGGRIAETEDPELACAEVSWQGDNQGGRVEINFGDGCQGPDGKVRKGTVVVEYEGHWLVKGSKVYTVLKNFSIDNISVEGTRILTNVSIDMESLVYTVEIKGGKIFWIGDDEKEYVITRESERMHTWIFGDGLDDFELHVEGHASGISRDGVGYYSEIDQPLIFKSSCRGNTIYLPTSGSKTIMINDKLTIKLNYGTGDCDNKVIVNIGEQNKEIEI